MEDLQEGADDRIQVRAGNKSVFGEMWNFGGALIRERFVYGRCSLLAEGKW